MTRIILILALVPFLGGCDMENVLTGKKTDTQKYHEARAEQGLPPPVNPWIEPVKLVADVPAPDPEPQPCRDIFREIVCIDGVPTPFIW